MADRNTVNWAAKWIWTTGRSARPRQFAYFRTVFDCPRAVRRARIHVAADSKYRLWVNGGYVGFGPARGRAEHPYYDTHRIALKKGANTIAVLVQHYTRPTSIFSSVRGGLLLQTESGGEVLAATDRTWRALPARAYGTLEGILLPEAYDARLEPPAWEQPGFDDSDWPAAKEVGSPLAAPAALLPRPIPLIEEKRLDPRTVLDFGSCVDEQCPDVRDEPDVADSLWRCRLQPGGPAGMFSTRLRAHQPWPGRPVQIRLRAGQAAYLMLDFGFETLAHPEIAVRAPGGVVVDLGYCERLAGNRVATRWQNHRQSERIILRAGLTRHRLSQPRGFRYMIVRIANPPRRRAAEVVLEDVCAHEAIYPARRRGSFRCSDPLLGRIYDLGARTVNLCMEDAFTDCPWRERAQWVGDAQPEALFNYYCFGAYDLARKAVLEFATGHTDEGWLPGVFPTARPTNLPTWGMRVPVIAWDYYLHSGDRSVLPAAREGARRQMNWLRKYEDRNGLAVDLPGWCFVDWTSMDNRCNDGAVQGWYLEALECSARIARAAGDAAAARDYRRRAGRLRKSLARLYWSEARGAFLKFRPGSPLRPPQARPDMIGQHENFLFSLLKVGTPAQRRRALQAVAGAAGLYLPDLGDYQCRSAFGAGTFADTDVMLLGTPFWGFYALLALMEAGEVGEALDYMRICWGLMLENGATSCWENWYHYISLCHGWSAAPVMILPGYVLGVRPTAPGFERFEVRPRMGDLDWARGRVPTPHGAIGVSWKRAGKRLACEITVPLDTRCTFVPPARSGARKVLRPGHHRLLVHGK